jgi:membrane-associated phospholipid phosphatase
MATKLIGFVLTAVIVALCLWSYDQMLAIYISQFLVKHTKLHKYAADIPDFLLLIVCITTAIAFTGYLTRSRKGIYNKDTTFLHLTMYAVPATYAAKTLLKYVCGRTTPREWLNKSDLYGFHWFRGNEMQAAFPSGHMAVFTAMAASLWRFYPRYRVIYVLFLLALAVALIATNYHFLSDVVAGAYLGILIEACTYKVLKTGH